MAVAGGSKVEEFGLAAKIERILNPGAAVVPASESLTMQPKMKMVVYINRKTGETWVQEIPQWSENTRRLAVECKVDCRTAAKALRLLSPWKIDA